MAALLVRGRWLALPWNLSDTVLTTYLLVSLVGDVTTLFSLRRDAWSGRWRVSWSSLALEVFPASLDNLATRMRRLGMTQAGVPLLATGLSGMWLFTGAPRLWSHSAMVFLTSLFLLLTTLLPALPRIAAAGSTLDRLRAPRWARANWLWAGALRALDGGAVLRELVVKAQLTQLLPPAGASLDSMSLLFQTYCCEVGDFEAARPLVVRWVPEHAGLPAWLSVDGIKHAGAFHALIDGDFNRANECLALVERLQLVPWYSQLLVACLAHAQGDPSRRAAAMSQWRAAVETHPRKGLLLGANRWVLSWLGDAPAERTP